MKTSAGTTAPVFDSSIATTDDGTTIAHLLINVQNVVSSEKFEKYLDIFVTRLIRTSEVRCVEYFEIVYMPCLEELMQLLPKGRSKLTGHNSSGSSRKAHL